MENTTTASATEPASASPSVTNSPKIQWASSTGAGNSANLQEQFEVARARNWISERLISQSQRHWHCTREEAIERLLAQQK